MKTEIIKIKGDWTEVLNDCRATVGKEPLDKEPSIVWKTEITTAEHSPIRAITIKWRWKGIPSWVATHWSRHKFEKYISTQRTDRTGVKRDKLPQDTPVTFVGEANVQSLIDAWRKRLCYTASPETRELAEDFKTTLAGQDIIIANHLVPNCVYRCGCPEPHGGCGWWRKWLNSLTEEQRMEVFSDIDSRYYVYNLWFMDKNGQKEGPDNDA